MTISVQAGQRLASLVEDIRSGSTRAEAVFLETYSSGFRFFLKRQLGPDDLDERLDQVCSMMFECIRGGWMLRDGRLMPLVHEAVSLCGFTVPAKEKRTDTARVHAIKSIVSGLTAREREALTRHCLDGEDAHRVTSSLRIDEGKFKALIAGLKSVVKRVPLKAFAAGAK